MADDYEGMTKAQLQAELRSRGIPHSGRVAELRERLAEDDEARADESEAEDDAGEDDAEDAVGEPGGEDHAGAEDEPPEESASAAAAASTSVKWWVESAITQLRSIIGLRIEGVSAMHSGEDGGRTLAIDVLEQARVPSSGDQLATYEVVLDAGGDLVGYERVARFRRNQASR